MKNIKKSILRGQTLVEFALIIPVFLLLVMFIFDVSRAVYYYSVMYNAVREGARVAAVGDPDTNVVGIQNVVESRSYGMKPDSVSVTWANGIVTVSADFEYQPITPLVSIFFPGGQLDLEVQSTMRLEFE